MESFRNYRVWARSKIDIQTIIKKAKARDAIALYNLANCYEIGEGVEKSEG